MDGLHDKSAGLYARVQHVNGSHYVHPRRLTRSTSTNQSSTICRSNPGNQCAGNNNNKYLGLIIIKSVCGEQ